jgi:pimeloyl-ACP methyl ester carboxylesterase
MTPQFFEVAEGTLAYDDYGGSGDLVIMLPGMGDLRHSYRFVAPRLRDQGYRVVTVDLRGHGESSPNWSDYSIEAVSRDILALIEHLKAGPAILMAASFSPGAAVLAAVERPSAVKALILIGPFVRDKMNSLQKLMLNLLMSGPWKVRGWDMFYRSLYPVHQPADLEAYRAQLRANLAEPGRFDAVKAMGFAPRAAAEANLSQVQAPTLVVMGSRDPDFKPPAAEAQFVADQLAGRVAMIEDAGHYPHVDVPEKFLPPVLDFLAEIGGRNGA